MTGDPGGFSIESVITVSLANQKGGVGKTTTALNLGHGLAGMGRRVLLLDLDAQASLTLATMGDCAGRSLAEVLGDVKPGKLTVAEIIRPLVPGLDLAPGHLRLADTEIGLTVRKTRETVLRRVLAGLAGYDLALIDCGPSVNLLTVNALVASDAVITPTLPTALDLRGLALFLDTLEDIRAELNPHLRLLGVLVCQYDSRLRLHQEALDDLRNGGIPLLPVIVSRSVAVATTAGAGIPLARGPVAEQYKQLAEYIDRWLTKANLN